MQHQTAKSRSDGKFSGRNCRKIVCCRLSFAALDVFLERRLLSNSTGTSNAGFSPRSISSCDIVYVIYVCLVLYLCMYVLYVYTCGLFNINDKGNRTIAPVGFFLYHLFPFFPSEADINYLIGPLQLTQATLKLYFNRERPRLSLTL